MNKNKFYDPEYIDNDSFWYCNVCGAQNSVIDVECQYCDCEGENCNRDNCSDPECKNLKNIME